MAVQVAVRLNRRSAGQSASSPSTQPDAVHGLGRRRSSLDSNRSGRGVVAFQRTGAPPEVRMACGEGLRANPTPTGPPCPYAVHQSRGMAPGQLGSCPALWWTAPAEAESTRPTPHGSLRESLRSSASLSRRCHAPSSLFPECLASAARRSRPSIFRLRARSNRPAAFLPSPRRCVERISCRSLRQ